MDHMTSKSDYGIYEPSAVGSSKTGGAGDIQVQLLDALQILTTPQMVVDDPKKLRDQFAMAALTGLISINPAPKSLDGIAEFSYLAADSMMKAREAK
jgi:hypothetical protein